MTNTIFKNMPDYATDPEGFKQWAAEAKPRFKMEESKWTDLGSKRHRSRLDMMIPRFQSFSPYPTVSFTDRVKRRINTIRDYLFGPFNRWDYRRTWAMSMDEMNDKVQAEREAIRTKREQREELQRSIKIQEQVKREQQIADMEGFATFEEYMSSLNTTDDIKREPFTTQTWEKMMKEDK
jgi:hypothetical protein